MAKVLVVDDEHSIRSTISEFLETDGHQVRVAEDAELAMQALNTDEFDVVVTDIILPRITGIRLLKCIHEASPHVQVVLMTGEPTVETASEAVRAGAFDYLSKPISREAILKTVANAVKVKTLDDERRRLEQHNRRYRENLEQLADERSQALRKSQTMLAKAQEIAHLGGWELDLEQNRVVWSDEVYRIFGLAPNEFDGTREAFYELVHPEDRELVRQAFADSIHNRTPYDIVHRIVRPDGEVRIVHERCEHTCAASGDVVGSMGVVQDITEVRQAQEQQTRLAAAIDQIAEAVVMTDAQGTIQYVNPAFEAITGYSPLEAIGQNLRILKSGMHDDAFYTHLWETISSGETWVGHFTNKRKDESLYEEDSTISPVRDATGRIVSYVAVKRDVSRERELEAQLRQAHKMEAIGTLAGGIAHDFNNILTAVLGYTELAKTAPSLDDNTRSYLEQVEIAGNRARDMVKQILTFSRQTEHQRRPLEPQPVIQEALKLLRTTIPATIEIQQDLDLACGLIVSDPTDLHQVVMNLCTNAYHAMREEGGTLAVRFEETQVDEQLAARHADLEPGRYARLTVSDTGQGIDEATVARMFEPFYTTKEVGEGTGLGLAMVHGIVKEHHGAITVRSVPGDGTTFEVFFPSHDLEAVVDTAETDEDSGPVCGNERILFVDDEPAIVDMNRILLEKMGYEVVPCVSSLQALELFRADPRQFDVVVTDQAMPQLAGLELAKQMIQLRPDIPIILCTGYSETVDRQRALAAGIREFSMKPVIARRLARIIRRVCERDEAAAR